MNETAKTRFAEGAALPRDLICCGNPGNDCCTDRCHGPDSRSDNGHGKTRTAGNSTNRAETRTGGKPKNRARRHSKAATAGEQHRTARQRREPCESQRKRQPRTLATNTATGGNAAGAENPPDTSETPAAAPTATTAAPKPAPRHPKPDRTRRETGEPPRTNHTTTTRPQQTQRQTQHSQSQQPPPHRKTTGANRATASDMHRKPAQTPPADATTAQPADANPERPPHENRRTRTKPRHTPHRTNHGERREPPTRRRRSGGRPRREARQQGQAGTAPTHPPSGSAGGGERTGPEARTGARARSGEANPCARPQRTAQARKAPRRDAGGIRERSEHNRQGCQARDGAKARSAGGTGAESPRSVLLHTSPAFVSAVTERIRAGSAVRVQGCKVLFMASGLSVARISGCASRAFEWLLLWVRRFGSLKTSLLCLIPTTLAISATS